MIEGERGRTFLRLVAIVLGVVFFFIYLIVGNMIMNTSVTHFLVHFFSWADAKKVAAVVNGFAALSAAILILSYVRIPLARSDRWRVAVAVILLGFSATFLLIGGDLFRVPHMLEVVFR